MTDSLFDTLTQAADGDAAPGTNRPPLPEPHLRRWQPLRLGLVELFRYDSEEFWFRDGHLLLRGNNGTGKSKVLSLVLPFLFDAQLKSSRIEPDGDPGKKMAWNLLLGTYPRRTGYTWIEFGRLDADGTPHYLTLGAGLQAVEGRAQVESWFFLIEAPSDGRAAPRLNRDLWLVNARRQVLGREKLREVLDGCGQVFETAMAYRLAVDQRLFGLGPERYGALMDTLIQLRQPQLSKKPDETALSNALTEALPPLSPDLLGDVAEALQRLEEDRLQLESHEALERAVRQFQRRYGQYAAALSRRQARLLRQAQTEFDQSSRALAEARDHLQAARQDEAATVAVLEQSELSLHASRARLDTLRADPTMQAANRLATAEREAQARERGVQEARRMLLDAEQRIAREAGETERLNGQWTRTRESADQSRHEALRLAGFVGLEVLHTAQPLFTIDEAALVQMAPHQFDAAGASLHQAVADRREAIARLRLRHDALRQALWQHQQLQSQRDERLAEVEDIAERRTQADEHVEQQAQQLIGAWHGHLHALQQLPLTPAVRDDALAALANWVSDPLDDAPPRHHLQRAHDQARQQFSTHQADLDQAQRQIVATLEQLDQERCRLEAGEDAAPQPPHWRSLGGRDHRPGAPLWQLIEFQDTVDEAARAGIEAALEASGLLDAWVSPDGQLQSDADRPDAPWQDAQLLAAMPAPTAGLPQREALSAWVRAPHNTEGMGTLPVAAEVIGRVLGRIACSAEDPGHAAIWISPEGRFRLGTLAGAWHKPVGTYLGFAARAAARERRLTEITESQERLSAQQRVIEQRTRQLVQDRAQADQEWRQAPDDAALHQAHRDARDRARDLAVARTRLEAADAACRAARMRLDEARQSLRDDAADLRLPEALDALEALQEPLERLTRAHAQMLQALQAWRLLHPERQRQQSRQDEALQDRDERQNQWGERRQEAEEAIARWQALRETVGVAVETLRQRITEVEQQVLAHDRALREAMQSRQRCGEVRAVAETRAGHAEQTHIRATDTRTAAVALFQRFAGTGLLAVALPGLVVPDLRQPWTIDPALTLARAAERDLADMRDDDDTRDRLQRQISQDLTELQGALAALGHRAQAESSDFGLVVGVIYQGRTERPDQLAARLADEIAQRRELLSANEREVLENHLQAEIAAEVQKLLQAAERQVAAINTELHKRPTSTGVRYRLRWEPLDEGSEGAPQGLEAARRHLLHTNADLWSAVDRRVIGTMLQQRILAERARAEASGTGSLLEQLARALDYRRWHVFRVQRWQDGQWRKLSGPASSGERALGLTVPLFAAVASFYGHSDQAMSPRLVLLDEAFAGIDDAARAHCMALIHEFDLDFVITSEREWACYAELPGVSICQLLRREGVDAVLVSRWTWDGRARRREDDPDRRFDPNGDTADMSRARHDGAP